MNQKTLSPLRARSRKTREAVVSGIFYPSSPSELSSAIAAFVEKAATPAGTCPAIISPHGSLDYSGLLSAKAWKAASARIVGTIVIVGPAHLAFEPGIFVPESRVFSIPTAVFSVDRPLVRELLDCTTNVVENDIPHLEEHSLEMQLLFAAHFFPEAAILPLIVSETDDANLDSLFFNLQSILGDRIASTLFVLTTNMAVDESPARCESRTLEFASYIADRNIPMLDSCSLNQPSFCGGQIISAFLRSTLSSAMDITLLGSGTSAEFAEQGEPVVGYSALGFSR